MTSEDAWKKPTVIVPAYNEEQTIAEVLRQVQATCSDIVSEIIVVDDGSSDGTGQAAEAAGVRVVRHLQNKGYGAAIKTGLRAAQTPFVITMDSDGQHGAEDVRRLWEHVDGNDMVVGQRVNALHSPLWRMPGKWVLSIMANYLTRQEIPDLNSGLRVINREIALRYLHLCPSGFSFSTTITMALLCRGYTVTFVPITVVKRQGRSTVSVATGLETIILILRIATLFEPLRIFVPLSIFVGMVGLLYSLPYGLLAGRGISAVAIMFILAGVQLFVLGLMSDQISQLRLERFE